jgi:hypothetical protein
MLLDSYWLWLTDHRRNNGVLGRNVNGQLELEAFERTIGRSWDISLYDVRGWECEWVSEWASDSLTVHWRMLSSLFSSRRICSSGVFWARDNSLRSLFALLNISTEEWMNEWWVSECMKARKQKGNTHPKIKDLFFLCFSGNERLITKSGRRLATNERLWVLRFPRTAADPS